MTWRMTIRSPMPGATVSRKATTRSPSASRWSAQVPSRSRYGAPWTMTLMTCVPAGASVGSSRVGIVASSHGLAAGRPYFPSSWARSRASMLGAPTISRPRSRRSPPAPSVARPAGRPGEGGQAVEDEVDLGGRAGLPDVAGAPGQPRAEGGGIDQPAQQPHGVHGAGHDRGGDGFAARERHPGHRVPVGGDAGHLGRGAQGGAGGAGRVRQRVGDRARAALGQDRLPRRAAVVTGRIGQQDRRGAG